MKEKLDIIWTMPLQEGETIHILRRGVFLRPARSNRGILIWAGDIPVIIVTERWGIRCTSTAISYWFHGRIAPKSISLVQHKRAIGLMLEM